VVCDDVTGSRTECGDLINAAAAGRFDWAAAVELNAIAADTVTVPRAGDAPVLFETQGVAIQDVAVCALAYERHVQRTGIKEATDDHVPPTLARRG
jgi:ornithine cyclodeaminase/alanine dehydrogenase-like protein (mu-crystallin family)